MNKPDTEKGNTQPKQYLLADGVPEEEPPVWIPHLFYELKDVCDQIQCHTFYWWLLMIVTMVSIK